MKSKASGEPGLRKSADARRGPGNPFRAVVRNFGTVMSGQATITLLGFIALSLNTRALGLEALGTLFLIQATCELTAKVLSFQNWQTMIKFGAEALQDQDGGRLKAAWRYGFSLDLLAAAVAALIAGGLFLWAPGLTGMDSEHGPYGLIYAASLLVSGSGTSVGALRVLERFSAVVAINVATAVFLVINAVVLWAIEAPLQVYLITIALITGGGSALLIVVGYLRTMQAAARMGDSTRSAPLDHPGFLRFALGVSATGTLNSVRQKGELLIVGALLGPAIAALFGVAYRVAALLARVGEAGRQSIYPVLGRMVADGKLNEASALAFRFFWMGLLLSVPAVVIVAIFGDDILRLLFGDKYAAASPNLLLLSISTGLYVVSFSISSLIQIEMGSGRFLKLNLVAFFLGFVPLTVLGPLLLGQAGAGVGAAAFSGILTVLNVRQLMAHVRSKGEAKA